MNDNPNTPKSAKDSRKNLMKQFLMSLLATTVSIALTFGTAAVVDHFKKQSDKRDIVMMVMYDMYNSLLQVEKADSLLQQSMLFQLKLAEDTSLFNSLRYNMNFLIPHIDYTETTERIFSSNIETINTVGNVLFTENVAEFYHARQFYKSAICDSIAKRISDELPFQTLNGTLKFDFFLDAILSNEMLYSMQQLFAECKLMMNISDEELQSYRRQREQMEQVWAKDEEAKELKKEKLIELEEKRDEAINKLNLE